MSIYQCWNQPRPDPKKTYLGQQGYEGEVHMGWDTYSRERVYVPIHSAFDTSKCVYTQRHASDKLCSGCVHRAKVES